MYRGVPEHPKVAEILRNGSVFDVKNAKNALAENGDIYLDLQFEVAEDDFAELCRRRLMNARCGKQKNRK